MHRKNLILLLSSLLLVTAAYAGCHEPEQDEIPSFTYTSTEFSFSGPDELPAGWVELVNMHEGEEPHHIQLFRLQDGQTGADYRNALENNETHPEWIESVGGPNTPNPGGKSQATVFLEAGEYVMICEIPDREGVPHVHRGMVKDVRVVDEDGANEPPEGDLTVSLVDFAFEKQTEWTPGEHQIEVVNDGGQAHELVLVRYKEGGNFSQLLESFGPNATGPPPADFQGGITGIATGDTQYFPADIRPGRYGFICFLEDPNTGAPHFALGMQEDFEVT